MQELPVPRVSVRTGYATRAIAGLDSARAKLLGNLSRLTCYLHTIGEKEEGWLLSLAPYVGGQHDAHDFLSQLLRLTKASPSAVSAALSKMLESYEPLFDYKDVMKNLVRALADEGLKQAAVAHADRLRRLPGMSELYRELTA